MENNTTHGGKRKGAGRKPKYNEPTTTIAFRVPISKVEAVKKSVQKIIKTPSIEIPGVHKQ